MLKKNTPKDIKDGRVYKLEEVAPYFTKEYLKWVDAAKAESIRIATIKAEENRIQAAKDAIWDARFQAVANVVNAIWFNTLGRIPMPTKMDIIMGTKKVVGWIAALGIVALTLAGAYGLFLSYGWIIANITIIGFALLELVAAGLVCVALLGLVKVGFEYLRTTEFKWVNKLKYWKPPTWMGYLKYIGYPIYLPMKWFGQLLSKIGNVFVFFKDGFMGFKADNCPELEIID